MTGELDAGNTFRWDLTPGGADEAAAVAPDPAAEPVDPLDLPTVAIELQAGRPKVFPARALPTPAAAAAIVPAWVAPPLVPASAPAAAPAALPPTEVFASTNSGAADVLDLEDLFAEILDDAPLAGERPVTPSRESLPPGVAVPPSAAGLDVARQPIDLGQPSSREAKPNVPLPRALIGTAVGLAAVLMLAGMFLLGSRIGQANAGAVGAVVTSVQPTTIPSPVASVGPGAVAASPGVHPWDQLGGGECLEPWVSAWEQQYTVVDCATPHAAQLALRGLFADAPDGAGTAYPGAAALQARIIPLCSAPTVIDLTALGGAADVKLLVSFPADEADWAAANRGFSCFIVRDAGAKFTGSVVLKPA